MTSHATRDHETVDPALTDHETTGHEARDRETVDPAQTDHETTGHETVDPALTDHESGDRETIDPEMTNHEATDHEATDREELVVLCAPDGSAAGTEPKATVHHRDTPLHLAFSCYVFDPTGRVLVTRRAYGKRTFPGVRTNSACGHPAPAEGMRAAVLRRLQQELGIVPLTLDLILPGFRYRATAADGTVENELCPVYRAVTTADVQLAVQRTEVHDAWWVPWAELASQISNTGQPQGTGTLGSLGREGRTSQDSGAGRASRADEASGTDKDGTDPLSLWCAQQVQQLARLGSDPLSWPAGDPALLPAAATP